PQRLDTESQVVVQRPVDDCTVVPRDNPLEHPDHMIRIVLRQKAAQQEQRFLPCWFFPSLRDELLQIPKLPPPGPKALIRLHRRQVLTKRPASKAVNRSPEESEYVVAFPELPDQRFSRAGGRVGGECPALLAEASSESLQRPLLDGIARTTTSLGEHVP